MYFQDEFAVPSGRVKQRNDRNDEATSEEYVNEKLSKQILTQARLQMQDLQRESDGSGNAVVSKKLPKLGDNMDSDEEDDGEGMFLHICLHLKKVRSLFIMNFTDEIGGSDADDYDKCFSNDRITRSKSLMLHICIIRPINISLHRGQETSSLDTYFITSL